MSGASICKHLAWDSEFFGFRIGRVTTASLDTAKAQAVLQWARDEQIASLYYLCPLAEIESARAACKAGFFLTDVRVTLEAVPAQAKAPGCGGRIRLAEPKDIAVLKNIAKISHHQTRFFADPFFPKPRCEALYETWIEKCCQSASNHVIVATTGEGIAQGYITCEIGEDKIGSIGLVAVDPTAQGQGLGQTLVNASLEYFRANDCPVITVVTQGQNLAAQRLYQRCGFLTRSVELWFHCWTGAKPAPQIP